VQHFARDHQRGQTSSEKSGEGTRRWKGTSNLHRRMRFVDEARIKKNRLVLLGRKKIRHHYKGKKKKKNKYADSEKRQARLIQEKEVARRKKEKGGPFYESISVPRALTLEKG